MTDSIVKVEGLSHRYARTWAIQDISFDIDYAGVVGLLGSNGAGKSTTMNIMCGVLNQTRGDVFINGIDLKKYPEEAKKHIGFLPQTAPLHLDLTVDEYLRHSAYMRMMPEKEIPAAIELAKERCGISHFSSRLIANLSGGYRQRVGIAQAIIHQPKLVVLDEPTNGLDPNQISEVRKLIREIAEERLVFFSSHILSEIQATCRRIIMIEGGRLVFSDSLDAFYNYLTPNSLLVTLEAAPAENSAFMSIDGITGVERLDRRRIRLRFKNQEGITEQVAAASMKHGWRLSEITLEKSSADEIFSQLSRSSVN